MSDTPETIYLIPGEDVDGAPCMVWCDDPAPGEGMDPVEAVKYIRADKHQEIIDRQARAAKMGMDAAKKSAEIMECNAKKMLAESSPEVIESERAANAVLTEENERLRLANADLEMVRELAENIRDIAIESPASNNMQLIYRLACQQAEHAGGDQ